jgi:hypothetical protein
MPTGSIAARKNGGINSGERKTIRHNGYLEIFFSITLVKLIMKYFSIPIKTPCANN